ncbi:hypothetical protein [uncultured Pseudokineococcus sp.]|uniref:hypothetical protein n=1 Tax=uncultured Pseudokineococcus sp. TaxID=1642928 RepID=UPI002623D997|nr:hypothetical protein [uncultured Pseudokineococcus sp.]
MSEQPPPVDGDDRRTDGTDGAGERPAPTEADLAGAQRVRYRRAPRYRVLVGLGVAVGAVLALVLALTSEPSATYSRAAVFGYLLAALGLSLGLLGGLVGVLLERVARRG